jgi:hypothetical protein
LTHHEQGRAFYNIKGKTSQWASTKNLHSEGNIKN